MPPPLPFLPPFGEKMSHFLHFPLPAPFTAPYPLWHNIILDWNLTGMENPYAHH